MDLAVVGRHAIFFDDDGMAAFVNSSDALVEWNSLQIDRYDVRHLLSAPLPPRLPQSSHYSTNPADSLLELELDHERYHDLSSSSPGNREAEEAEGPGNPGGYGAVPFSYGNTSDFADLKNADGELEFSGFRPPFPIPESLFQRLPPTEKLHQIIARTAIFVNQHGGQSEIVLRVKQGDNPTFGFLMPDDHLHPYFRFLVENPELLQSNVEKKTQLIDKTVGISSESAFGGALTLLGSVYGSGEDEDGAAEGTEQAKCGASEETESATCQRDFHSLEMPISTDADKDEVQVLSKISSSSSGEAPTLRRNPSVAASKAESSKKRTDDLGSYIASLKTSREPLAVEPPSDVMKLIDKIVEFILKNGKTFEASLREQDSKQLRFSFLLPSDQYHPYYLQVLQRAQESKVGQKNPHGIDDSGRGPVRRGLSQERGIPSSRSVASEGKFKMVIGKSKKDVQDLPSKTTQQESGVTMDVAAAILKAATRGIKNPDKGVLSIPSMNANSSVNADIKNLKNDQGGRHSTSDTVSSEACMTKEQKLKAERLKRAKMFVAKFKDGSLPSGNELPRSSSVEPVASRASWKGSNADHVVEDKENAEIALLQPREGSSEPTDGGVLNGSTIFERKHYVDEDLDHRSKRKYRSRSERNEEYDEENRKDVSEGNHSKRIYESSLESDNGGNSDATASHRKHSNKRRSSDCTLRKDEGNHHNAAKYNKHRSHRYSDDKDYGDSDTDINSGERTTNKHSSHCSSREDDDEHGDKHQKHKHSKKKHRSHRSSPRSRERRKLRISDSSRDEESRVKSKHDNSCDDAHEKNPRNAKEKKGSHSEKEDLEEGEISYKVSEHVGGLISYETSIETRIAPSLASSQLSQPTDVPDDLRVKIRAMLIATR